nr:M15 family metallopeptidase [Cellulomonas sp. APG4]
MIAQITAETAAAVAQAEQDEYDACFAGDTPTPGGSDVTLDGLTSEQSGHAVTILAVVKGSVVVPGGAADAVQRQAGVVAIATAMQESSLRNLDGGDRDSLGLFQQRPSMGWGTTEQITDPVYATTAFLYGATTNPGLVDVDGWEDAAVTVAAQAVQRSGHPNAYAKWETLARAAVDTLWDDLAAVAPHPDLDRPELGDDGDRTVPLRHTPDDGAGCELLGDDFTPIVWDGVYRKPQPWGGYSNGKIPLAAMCAIPWAPQHLARCDAVDAIVALNREYKADHGKNLAITSSYRSYEAQVATKRAKGPLAATPGTSNHGWGMALDLANFGGVNQYNMPNYLWMMEHGPKYGWVNPPWAQAGGFGPLEPWHWEFMGNPTSPAVAATFTATATVNNTTPPAAATRTEGTAAP